jgi:hypothetical protein
MISRMFAINSSEESLTTKPIRFRLHLNPRNRPLRHGPGDPARGRDRPASYALNRLLLLGGGHAAGPVRRTG